MDPPAAQLAMNERWHLPFRWVSDPGGEQLAKPLYSWNAEERGGLFRPVVLLVAPDGSQLLRHDSRDFADRPDDSDVLDALREAGLPQLQTPQPWAPEGISAERREGAFRTEAFGPYFRALSFGGRALSGRMRDPHDAAEAKQLSTMAGSFLEAWKQRREQVG